VTSPLPDGTRRADALLGAAASVVLFCMMLLTVVDVVARYRLRMPVRGAFEVTELMLVVRIFAGLPLVSFADEHAVMDFIDRLLGPRGLRTLRRGVQLFNAAFMFLLAWLMWGKAARIWAYQDATDVLRILYGPFVYFMVATLALAGLIHLYKVVDRG
jgi:TRAP-type C4-dicarboxylate transport system permease small subunit